MSFPQKEQGKQNEKMRSYTDVLSTSSTSNRDDALPRNALSQGSIASSRPSRKRRRINYKEVEPDDGYDDDGDWKGVDTLRIWDGKKNPRPPWKRETKAYFYGWDDGTFPEQWMKDYYIRESEHPVSHVRRNKNYAHELNPIVTWYFCCTCGGWFQEAAMQIGHIIPWHKYCTDKGAERWEHVIEYYNNTSNLALICATCNASIGETNLRDATAMAQKGFTFYEYDKTGKDVNDVEVVMSEPDEHESEEAYDDTDI